MEPFLGEIKLFCGNYAPIGWAFCDGSLLPISENEALYSLIGTTYGGDGTSTFALPDLRGRVAIHQGQGSGLSPYAMGQVGGLETVTLATNNLPQHSHRIVASTNAGTAASPANALLAVANAGNNLYRQTTGATAFNPSQVGVSNGGNQPHENRQPYQAINYIIATAGVWPSQS